MSIDELLEKAQNATDNAWACLQDDGDMSGADTWSAIAQSAAQTAQAMIAKSRLELALSEYGADLGAHYQER